MKVDPLFALLILQNKRFIQKKGYFIQELYSFIQKYNECNTYIKYNIYLYIIRNQLKPTKMKTANFPSTDNLIFTDSVWSDNEDLMYLEVMPDGSVYGYTNKYDFMRPNIESAKTQLQTWGFHYIGVR